MEVLKSGRARGLALTAAAVLAVACAVGAQPEGSTGPQLYQQSCAACHGPDGRGSPQPTVAFETPLPDFTDCNFANREPDSDWLAISHDGGPARAFNQMMPSFGGALTEAELHSILGYIRSLCSETRFPRGELNLPRPIATEKAFPEDEAVVTTAVNLDGTGGVTNYVVYEKRYGAVDQIEVKIPLGWLEQSDGTWTSPRFGDLAVGWKHVFTHSVRAGSILSGFIEGIFPTGSREVGFGKGTTIIEPALAFGQILPASMFIQLHAGGEFPVDQDAAGNEVFGRGTFGTTFTRGRGEGHSHR